MIPGATAAGRRRWVTAPPLARPGTPRPARAAGPASYRLGPTTTPGVAPPTTGGVPGERSRPRRAVHAIHRGAAGAGLRPGPVAARHRLLLVALQPPASARGRGGRGAGATVDR